MICFQPIFFEDLEANILLFLRKNLRTPTETECDQSSIPVSRNPTWINRTGSAPSCFETPFWGHVHVSRPSSKRESPYDYITCRAKIRNNVVYYMRIHCRTWTISLYPTSYSLSVPLLFSVWHEIQMVDTKQRCQILHALEAYMICTCCIVHVHPANDDSCQDHVTPWQSVVGWARDLWYPSWITTLTISKILNYLPRHNLSFTSA